MSTGANNFFVRLWTLYLACRAIALRATAGTVCLFLIEAYNFMGVHIIPNGSGRLFNYKGKIFFAHLINLMAFLNFSQSL
jgi:hypothetical protein